MKRTTSLAMLAAGVAAGIVSALASGITINRTASMPRGLWIATFDQSPARPGDIVLICGPGDEQTLRYVGVGACPNGLMPLLKPVEAVAGDQVSVDSSGITINNVWYPLTKPLERDTAGRPLVAYPHGTYTVPPGKVWLFSTYAHGSYDSRYFGPIDASAILHKERPLWTFQ